MMMFEAHGSFCCSEGQKLFAQGRNCCFVFRTMAAMAKGEVFFSDLALCFLPFIVKIEWLFFVLVAKLSFVSISC